MKKYIAYVSSDFGFGHSLIFSDTITTIANECNIKYDVDEVRKRVDVPEIEKPICIEIFVAGKTKYTHYESLDLRVSTDDLCQLLEEEIFKPKKS